MDTNLITKPIIDRIEGDVVPRVEAVSLGILTGKLGVYPVLYRLCNR